MERSIDIVDFLKDEPEAFDIHNFGPWSFYQDTAIMKSNTPKRISHLKHAATEKKVT